MNAEELKVKEFERHGQTLREIIWERYRFFPLVSELSMVVVAVVAFGALKDWYPKLLITLLLCLAVASLWFYFVELRRSELHVLKKI